MLYDDRERATAAAAVQKSVAAALACRWIYLSIFVRRGHNAAGYGGELANYIRDLLTAGWKWKICEN